MTTEQPRILLADDEETFRRSTARLLEQEGYRCDCAGDSAEASRLLTEQHDALVSDIRMPGNMQFEFLRDVRARFPMLPIVLVTGYPSVQTAVEALRLAFTDYLLKPIDWPDLLRAVNQAVEKARFLRMTEAARVETDRLNTSLDRLQEIITRSGTLATEHELAWSLNAFLSQSVAQMTVLSAGIRSVMAGQLRGQAEAPTDVCRMMQCPRLTAYQEALQSTVEVLEKTKDAFRSRDLGLLRKKIEQLLSEGGDS
ncbi:MAG: response regulator [Nitrospira sp.]